MDPVGAALVGLGKVATAHAEALASLPGSRLVAVFDELPVAVQAFAERFGARPCASLHEVLDDPAVSMVDICTPHPTHARIAIEAATSGRHVLVEKPMASTVEDCDAMIGAAAQHGVRLGVVSQRRWYEPVQRVRSAIVEGKIGDPVLATLTLLGWRDESYYRMAPWRGTWAGEGGGVLVNQASHHLDLLQWLVGPVEEVFGYWGNFNHPTIEVEDTAVAVLRFVGGALGAVTLSNSQRPGLYGRIHVHGRNGASVGVQTESGSSFVAGVSTHVEPALNDIWTVPGEERLLTHWQHEDRVAASRVDPMAHYHRLQLEDFVDAIATDRRPLVTGHDGRTAVELFSAVYASQRKKSPVRLPIRTGTRSGDWRLQEHAE